MQEHEVKSIQDLIDLANKDNVDELKADIGRLLDFVVDHKEMVNGLGISGDEFKCERLYFKFDGKKDDHITVKLIDNSNNHDPS